MKKFSKAVLLSMMFILVCAPSFAAEDVIRIGILRFASKADGISQWNAESITDELTRMLASSYSIAIIDRSSLEAIAQEHRMNLAGLIDPRTAAQLGHLAGIQYLITGAITHFGVTENVERSDSTGLWNVIGGRSAGNLFGSKKVEKTENAEVTLDLRIIDVNTQEVVLSMAETGKATRKATAQADNIGAASSNVDSTSLRDAAVSDAVARIGQRIREAVAGEYPQVLRVSGGEIFISIGATSGAKVGNYYKISYEGEEIYDMRGNVIGRETKPIAVIRVDDVKNDYSVARVVKKAGNPANIQRGDRVEPSSSGEASDLAKRKAFLERRPRKLTGAELEGENLDSRLDSISSERPQRTEYTPQARPEPSANISASSVEYEPNYSRSSIAKFETVSTNAKKVIEGYGLSGSEKENLVERHKQAEKMLSRDEKFNRYTEIFNAAPYDYLAAYQAAKIAFDIGHNVEAREWAEKALSVNPRYTPAKKILKAANSKLN